MNSNQKTLVELILFPALQAFHECDDKNERENRSGIRRNKFF